MSQKKILVDGTEIKLYTKKNNDYICITDMAGRFGDRAGIVIQTWLRAGPTIEFLGTWELSYNPDFNYSMYTAIKEKVGFNSFFMSVKQWVEETGAIGLEAKAGRYIRLCTIAAHQLSLLANNPAVKKLEDKYTGEGKK